MVAALTGAISRSRDALREGRGQLPDLHPACAHQAVAARKL